MKTFFQHRAEMIFTGIKECNDPYLVGGPFRPCMGHLRYGHYVYDYERAKRDFDFDWYGHPPYPPRSHYKRRKIMLEGRKRLRVVSWLVDIQLRDAFGETVYGKMLAKIRSKS